jgi:basic amino acid/polyamine antiporter, APA family
MSETRRPDNTRNDQLRRVLTFWPLLFYGLGVIIGAGIYVALGEVIVRAGSAAPLSFLIAGICAGLTGLCYAELAARYPEAAGAAAYVQKAFSSKAMGVAVGLATTLAAAVSAAAIAHGAVSYVDELLPLSQEFIVALLIISFGVLSCYGVQASVSVAAIFGALELLGLAAAFGMGLYRADGISLFHFDPNALTNFSGITAGAFVAFFAYVGFETLANMAEEVRDPEKTVPRTILVSVGISLIVYFAVSVSAVIGGAVGDSPLASLFKGHWATLFSLLVFFTIASGTLVQVNMLSRLFYGMARLGDLPKWLASVNGKTGTPIQATLLATTIILITSLAFNFKTLITIVNFLTLSIFIAVDLALLKLNLQKDSITAFRAPRWAPILAIALSIGMIVAEIIQSFVDHKIFFCF